MPSLPKWPTILQSASGPALTAGQGEGLFYSALCPHLEHWLHVWPPQNKKDKKLLDSVQRRAMKVVNGQGGKMFEDRLRSLGVFSPEQRS